jgi:hypothetical protein
LTNKLERIEKELIELKNGSEYLQGDSLSEQELHPVKVKNKMTASQLQINELSQLEVI